MSKRPAFQFYPSDWRKDPALAVCSLAARGLWIEMMCIAHESSEYGVLVLNEKPMTEPQIARMVGESPKVVKDLLTELEDAGVFSRREDGAIYSRRMVKDERIRNVRAEAGRLGGSPDLGVNYNVPGYVYVMRRASGSVKIGISQSPDKRAYKLRRSMDDNSIKVIARALVDDMGKAEAALHKKYQEFCIGGEWFSMSDEEVNKLVHHVLHLKVNDEANKPPSSSSSSSSSTSVLGTDVPTAKRKRQLPDDFVLTEDREAVMRTANPVCPDVSQAFEQFCDYHRSRGNVMLDWEAAWRTWCRNSKTFTRGNTHGKQSESPLDRIQAAYRREFG